MYAKIDKSQPIVQKYGGTSMGSAETVRRIAQRVAKQYNDGFKKISIVVSARSGETNRLIDMISEVNPRASGPAYDMALAAGEQVSVAIMAAGLEAAGVQATPLLAYKLGIFTDDLHAKARIKHIQTEMIEKAWNEGKIPVVAGFQGISSEMDITTLGRGGSDTSAVALAVAVKAGFCEINTDVDGVFTTDPRICSDAKLIKLMDFEVALEMASLGSKVLHPRCVELGAKHQMPLVVRNTFTPDDHQRTIIMNLQNDNLLNSDAIEALVVSGITLDRNIAKLTLKGLNKDAKAIADIFTALAEKGINVDIIVHDQQGKDASTGLGFTIAKTDLDLAKRTLDTLSENKDFKHMLLNTETGLAKVSAVGVGMRSYAGVAARTFAALQKSNVHINMISTSEIKISCVVPEKDAELAVKALHQEFC